VWTSDLGGAESRIWGSWKQQRRLISETGIKAFIPERNGVTRLLHGLYRKGSEKDHRGMEIAGEPSGLVPKRPPLPPVSAGLVDLTYRPIRS
jgi:hypothetical protein